MLPTEEEEKEREGKCRLKKIYQLIAMCGSNLAPCWKSTCKIYEPIGEIWIFGYLMVSNYYKNTLTMVVWFFWNNDVMF